MNAVVFYSNTGKSKAVASYFAERLEYPLVEMNMSSGEGYRNLVLVFPVHCQNIPEPVKAFLNKVSVENLTVIATYGKMCCGNVLHEIQKRYRKHIVAGAYVPTKHAYIASDDDFCAFDRLLPIVEKIQNPSAIELPGMYKNPFANIFPGLRSRLGIRIRKGAECNGCNMCSENCSQNAITAGVVNRRCIRCLKCVSVCPRHALTVKIALPLRLYLRKKKSEEIIVYV